MLGDKFSRGVGLACIYKSFLLGEGGYTGLMG